MARIDAAGAAAAGERKTPHRHQVLDGDRHAREEAGLRPGSDGRQINEDVPVGMGARALQRALGVHRW
jgi:hypothetical protein